MSDDKLIASIEAEITRIEDNGKQVSGLPGGEDEGRCRQLCAMYLREFIRTIEASRADAPKDDKSEPSEDEMGQARSITDAINAQVDSESAPKDAPPVRCGSN